MMYPTSIYYFVDDKNHQILINFVSVLFNTEVNSLRHYDHISTFRNVMLTLILHNNKYLRSVVLDSNMITVVSLD